MLHIKVSLSLVTASSCLIGSLSCPAGSIDLGDLSRLVDAAASLTSADDVTLQDILETLDVPERCGGGGDGDGLAAGERLGQQGMNMTIG